MIDLLEGLAKTRTIRRYADEKVPDEVLSQILWHATRAPSGSNRQLVRYLVLRDDPASMEAREVLGRVARATWAKKLEMDGYTSGTGVDPASPKARMAATMQHYVDHFHEVPVIVLVCLMRNREPSPYEGASVYPAVQNLLLAARALDYGGAVCMWHQLVDADLRRIFSIPDEVALSACITLGRPAGSHGPVRRRPLRDVVFEGGWGEQVDWATDPEGTRFTHWKS